METKIVELPKYLDAFLINEDFLTAAVLKKILSAPDFNKRSISLIFLIPPPTMIGKNIFFEVSFIMLSKLLPPLNERRKNNDYHFD
jgi:hypothetical protein